MMRDPVAQWLDIFGHLYSGSSRYGQKQLWGMGDTDYRRLLLDVATCALDSSLVCDRTKSHHRNPAQEETGEEQHERAANECDRGRIRHGRS